MRIDLLKNTIAVAWRKEFRGISKPTIPIPSIGGCGKCYPSGDGMVLFFADFTEERAAREELRERREAAERQRNEIGTLYRTAPIGLALLDAKEFRILRLNNRQAEFFGLTPDQTLGRSITETAPIEGLYDLLKKVSSGKEVRDYLIDGELVAQPGNYRYWMVSAFPLYGADGSVEAIRRLKGSMRGWWRGERCV